jgi:hypothetical protein
MESIVVILILVWILGAAFEHFSTGYAAIKYDEEEISDTNKPVPTVPNTTDKGSATTSVIKGPTVTVNTLTYTVTPTSTNVINSGGFSGSTIYELPRSTVIASSIAPTPTIDDGEEGSAGGNDDQDQPGGVSNTYI